MSDKLKPKGNYKDSVEKEKPLFPDWLIKGIDWINAKTGLKCPTGASNCTLTATQYVDPKIPISRALTIIDDGEYYGWSRISESDLKQNDLIIAENPDLHSYHTMVMEGLTPRQFNFNYLNKSYFVPKNHPLVSYSTGTTDPSGIRENIPLMSYIDNSHGKTKLHYFRRKYYRSPEVVITPK